MRKVSITLDTEEMEHAIASLTETIDRVDQLIHGLIGLGHLGSELARIVVCDDATIAAPNIRVCLKPSDRFLQFVAAVKALESHLLATKMLTDTRRTPAETDHE